MFNLQPPVQTAGEIAAPVKAIPYIPSEPRTGADVFLAGLLSSVIVVVSWMVSRESVHWFMAPVALCGWLCLTDSICWLRGGYDSFDPKGLIGAYGVYFFFLAPILHVTWSHSDLAYTSYNPSDWRMWLGLMGGINLISLLAYEGAHAYAFRASRGPLRTWRISPEQWLSAVLFVLTLAVVAQTALLVMLGGVSGIAESYVQRTGALSGYGWLLMLAEPVPLLLLITFIVCASNGQIRRRQKAILPLIIVGIALVVAQFVLGGLRGSRSNTVWFVFCAAGAVHLSLRPIRHRTLLIAAVPFLAFMYVYGFYKTSGYEVLDALEDPTHFIRLEERSGRGKESLLLGDLGRANVQAFILHRLENTDTYSLRYGSTYVAALMLLIPSSLRPLELSSKVDAGTEAIQGKSTYGRSSRVYGLAGEAMLNFGYLGVPITFAVWGAALGIWRKKSLLLSPVDSRRLLVPVGSLLLVIALASDLGNMVFAAVKNGLLPAMMVWLMSAVNKQYE